MDIIRKLSFCFLFLIAGITSIFGQSEYKYEPIFTYNFTKYVKWPAGRSGDFIIGVCGSKVALERFKSFFDVSRRNKGGQNIVVKPVSSLSEIEDCSILFLTKNAKIDLAETSKIAIKQSILVVTEQPKIVMSSSMINMIVVDGKMKFELNQQLTERAKLQISAELRRLAILL